MTQPTLRPRLSLLPLALLGATATQAAPIQLPTQTVLGASDDAHELTLPLARSTLFLDQQPATNLGANLSESLQRVPTIDPLRGSQAHVGELFDRCETPEEFFLALTR